MTMPTTVHRNIRRISIFGSLFVKNNYGSGSGGPKNSRNSDTLPSFCTCFQMAMICSAGRLYRGSACMNYRMVVMCWLQDVTVDDIRVRRPLPKLLRYGSPPEIHYLSCSFCLPVSLKNWNYYGSVTLIDWFVYNVRCLTKQLIYSKYLD